MGGAGEDPLGLLPELVLLLGTAAALVLGLWTPRRSQGRVRRLGIAALLGSAVAALPPLLGPDRMLYDGTWVVDGVTGAVRVGAALASVLVLLLSGPTFRAHPRESEVTVLVLLATLGAVAVAAAGDLLMLVAAYLLASVPLYALVGFAKDAGAVEGALKHYLVGAFCGVLLMLGSASLLLVAGSTGYDELATALPGAPRPVVALGVLGVLVGVLFKAGGVPAHYWVPDAVAGTTTPAAALVTTVPKLGGAAAAWRLVDGPFAAAPVDVVLVVALLATASMTLGNLAAFRQDDVHRLLAYSSISQVGYLLVIAASAGSALAPAALATYLLAYAVTNVGAFAVVAAVPGARALADWNGLGRRRPVLGLALAVLLLGLVGTPPTAVFVGKLAAFAAAVDAGLLWLAVVAAVNTVASVFYYLRWLAPLVLGTPAGRAPAVLRAPAAVAATGAVLALLLGVGAGGLLALQGT